MNGIGSVWMSRYRFVDASWKSTPARYVLVRAYQAFSVLACAVSARRFRTAVLALVGYPLVIVATAKIFKTQPVVRREGAEQVEQDAASLDLSYRNPLWAKSSEYAKVAQSGFDLRTCVDGTADLLAVQRSASTSIPTISANRRRLDVWLLPFATYHIEELGPVIGELAELGLDAGLVFALPPTPAQLAAAAAYVPEVYLAEEISHLPPAVALSMMDWGPADQIRRSLLARGTRFLSKVEGAQDFRNLDTPRWETPYSRSTCVLAQGPFDAWNVAADYVVVTGSARIERIVGALGRGEIEDVDHGPLINLNFSYGTYEAWLRPWHYLAHRGASAARCLASTSVHPAVVAPWAVNRTSWPLALELETSSHLITRASTALFDALVIGRPAIYFNPHGERSWNRVPWGPVVPRIRTAKGLARCLSNLDPYDPIQIAARQKWVGDNFLSIDPELPAARRAAVAVGQWS